MHLLSSVCQYVTHITYPRERSMLHVSSDLKNTLYSAWCQNMKNIVSICDKTSNYCCILEASKYSPRLSRFLTFQSVPTTISPHHNVKLKVGHGVISRSDCSPPSNPWETKQIFSQSKNTTKMTEIIFDVCLCGIWGLLCWGHTRFCSVYSRVIISHWEKSVVG